MYPTPDVVKGGCMEMSFVISMLIGLRQAAAAPRRPWRQQLMGAARVQPVCTQIRL